MCRLFANFMSNHDVSSLFDSRPVFNNFDGRNIIFNGVCDEKFLTIKGDIKNGSD